MYVIVFDGERRDIKMSIYKVCNISSFEKFKRIDLINYVTKVRLAFERFKRIDLTNYVIKVR